MSTYTREYLNKLHNDFKLEMYNKHTDKIIDYITKGVIDSARCYGKQEFMNVVRIIQDNHQEILNRNGQSLTNNIIRQIDHTTIDVYDTKQIDTIINKLKSIFPDLNIEFVESKDLRGNILKSAIRVNWD